MNVQIRFVVDECSNIRFVVDECSNIASAMFQTAQKTAGESLFFFWEVHGVMADDFW